MGQTTILHHYHLNKPHIGSWEIVVINRRIIPETTKDLKRGA